jgi:hypothetical protein
MKDKSMIETYTRKAKFASLQPYCHLAKKHSYIEVTEWSNGEGFDVSIGAAEDRHFSLSWGEYQALQALVSYQEDKND